MTTTNELHVIFGSGPMGAAIMRELLVRGKRVRIINRKGKPSLATGTPANVEFVSADLYSAGSGTMAAQGATHIYQAAQPEYHEWPEKFPPLQQAVLDAAIANKAKLIVVENLYMYGDTNGVPISEQTPYRPTAKRKGELRLRLTNELMAAHQRGDVQVVMGRGADFFGPGDMVQGAQIFLPALQGKTANGIGNLDLPHTFTYTSDFGKALVILGEHDEAYGRAWHVPSAAPISQRELIGMVYEQAGTKPSMRALTPFLASLLGLFVPPIKEMGEMMYEFQKPFVMDSSAFTNAFGMTATPYRESVRETLAWFRANLEAVTKAAH